MDLSDIDVSLQNLNETIGALTGGLMRLSGTVAQQGAMLTRQTDLLSEIRDILTAEPDDENPLVTLIKQLVQLIENQAVVLTQIERAVTDQGSK